jgi:hypothetical protein
MLQLDGAFVGNLTSCFNRRRLQATTERFTADLRALGYPEARLRVSVDFVDSRARGAGTEAGDDAECVLGFDEVRALSKETTADCAPIALASVRQFGGVLEHPKGSTLFRSYDLPLPGHLPDAFGGITIEVRQCDWGHVARKWTWLYVVGCRDLPPCPPVREPTHWASGVHTPGARGKPPAGIKICSAEQRRRTPPGFALWLLEVARRCGEGGSKR